MEAVTDPLTLALVGAGNWIKSVLGVGQNLAIRNVALDNISFNYWLLYLCQESSELAPGPLGGVTAPPDFIHQIEDNVIVG